MWLSQSLVSLKASKSILEYSCICPFRERPRFQCTYYILFFLVSIIVFFGSFYYSLIYSGDLRTHMEDYDTFYIARQIKRLTRGLFFCLIIILSMCSRSAQLKLHKQMADLDIKLKSYLGVEPSFCRFNFEFIVTCGLNVVYHYGSISYHIFSLLDPKHISWHIYLYCSILILIHFFVYGVYTIYWARAYVYRSEYIIDALKTAISQRFISKSSLSMIMEMINLLFDIQETIQNAFGSILFVIISWTTLETAHLIFSLIHLYERERDQIFIWLDYLIWSSIVWAVFVSVFVSFSKIGGIVSEFLSLRKLFRRA